VIRISKKMVVSSKQGSVCGPSTHPQGLVPRSEFHHENCAHQFQRAGGRELGFSDHTSTLASPSVAERCQGTIIQTRPLLPSTTLLPLSPPSSHRSVTHPSMNLRMPIASMQHVQISQVRVQRIAERLVSQDDNHYAPLTRHYRRRSRK
jgi:hypothetical protein